MLKFIFIFLLNIFCLHLQAKDLNDTKSFVIYINENADHIKKFAAKELQKHLFLVTGTLAEIRNMNQPASLAKISFFVGIAPSNKNLKALENEESRFYIENQKVYIYGDDKIKKRHPNMLKTVLNFNNHTGTLFAVYDFLFQELGMRWIEPGNKGISYKKQTLRQVEDKNFSWVPRYEFRTFRMRPWQWRYLTGKKINMRENISNTFQPSKQEVDKRYDEESIWLRRMKLGFHNKPKYGHAFTHYWEKYGETHPEWFALDRFGFRGKTMFNNVKASRVKFCVTNKGLQEEIIENWQKDSIKNHYYNASINDSRGYCTCSNCKLLDPKTDTKNMTDRYVYFWNTLLDGIKKHDDDAKLILYAYSDYSHKPTTRRISSDITIGLVPKYTDSIEVIKDNLSGWRASGMINYFLRPNDFTHYIGLPAGNEKYIFDRYNVFKNNDMLGVDYERNYVLSNWETNGIGQYILARSISENKSFGELEDEYLDTFGNAKKDIAGYYRYWRNIFSKKHLKMILHSKYNKKFLYNNIKTFYKEKDFIYAREILNDAHVKAKDSSILKRIKRMSLANEHALLIFNAIVKNTKQASCELYNFRKQHKNKLSISLPMLLFFENKYKITGIKENCI